jgi:transcriptional regulator with XRE-family HTH domain
VVESSGGKGEALAPSPVVARWELSRRLGARRRELGVDVKTITDALGFTRNYWSAVENDRTLIAEDKLRLLFDVLSFDDQDQRELLQLREDSRKRGWWDEFPSLTEADKRFYGMEAGAVRIRAYDGHVMPGVLQIAPYSRSIFEADPFSSPVDIEPAMAVRQRRQAELLDRSTPTFEFLLSEAALRQQVAGEVVQVRQLQHVDELVRSERIGLRVIPLSANPGIIASSSTLIFLEFADRGLPAVAVQEAIRHLGSIEQDDEQYRALDTAWRDGSARALSAEASREMILEIARGLS